MIRYIFQLAVVLAMLSVVLEAGVQATPLTDPELCQRYPQDFRCLNPNSSSFKGEDSSGDLLHSGVEGNGIEGGNGSSAHLPQKIDWRAYLARLQRDVESQWEPGLVEESMKTMVDFTINKDGTMSFPRIVNSSGDREVDESALSAVRQAAPFEPLPTQFTGESVDIHFSFDLNVR